MSGELTLAMGRLLTDASLRKTLRQDPEEASRILNVDAQTLREIDSEALEFQSQGLIDKRFHEAAKRLPRTLAGLVGGGGPVFREYAASRWPEGHDRHLQDCAGFVGFLESRGLPLCRAERNRVLFASGSSRIAFRWAPDVWAGGRPRRAIQILIRIGSTVRSCALYLGL